MSGTGEEVGVHATWGITRHLSRGPSEGQVQAGKKGNSKLGLRLCLMRCQLISRQEQSGNKSGKKKLKNEKGPSTLRPVS